MRYHEIIDEYQMIADPPFHMPDFSNGKRIGIINVGSGTMQVWKLIDGNELGYAAIDSDKTNRNRLINPVAFVGFQVAQGLIIARNALTDPSYRGKGIISELFLFANKVDKHKILSDTQLSAGGEALWNKMIKSPYFSAKILYIPTGELFDITDVGHSKTNDGQIVISPKDDFFFDDFYDATTGNGQRFAYLLEHHENRNFVIEENGKTFKFGYCVSKHTSIGGILQPIRYFENGDP